MAIHKAENKVTITTYRERQVNIEGESWYFWGAGASKHGPADLHDDMLVVIVFLCSAYYFVKV